MTVTPRADRLILAITADRIRYLLETQPAGLGEDTRTGLHAALLCLEADVRALDTEAVVSNTDIDAVLGEPKTPDDLITDARWWLKELGGPLPEASPMFKALCQVVRENDRLREGYCSEAYIVMVQALDVKALGKGRRRILAEQARRMAAVGLGRGKPRAPGMSARRLAEDVLARLHPEDGAA